MGESTPAPGWTTRRWALPAIVVLGLAVRVALLPAPGFSDDIDQFVEWVGHIARNGLAHAYDAQLSFGPVMVLVWWLLGLVDPAIVAAASSDDVWVRIVMKIPAIAADLALAGVAWLGLRARPGWATAAVAVLLLHPAIWFVSAWWGTYDSVYTAFAAAGLVLAARDRKALAVVAVVLAVMSKPQAAPLVVPFGAWFLARAGWRGADARAMARAVGRLAVQGAIGLAVLLVLWVPFLAANGPANYLAGLARYQGEFYFLLSISAWNPWWAIQEILAPGKFILDSGSFVGGLSFRVLGYLLTGLLLLVIAACVLRRPTPRMLALSLAAAALVAFELLTTMHERYAFAVLPMLAFLLDDRRIRWFVLLFGTTFMLNMISATEHLLHTVVPFHGPFTIAGSVVSFAAMLFLVLEVVRSARAPEPAAVVNEAASVPFASAPPSTSAGSAGATSAA